MGGNMTYTFTGYNAGTNKYTFDVTLKMYRYCVGAGTTPLPTTLPLGVYNQDTANPTASKARYSIEILSLIESSFITPPNANDSCTFLPTTCVEEGIYQVFIQVDPSPGGYHLIVDRCCRNANIANMLNPGDAGQAYYAFIPPTAIANSAPLFGQAPIPFICAGDTVTYDNSAFDPDGDSLAYSFEVPYNGISNTVTPNPNPPLLYSFPIAGINWAGGYSLLSPLGASGYASIDPSTGLTYYLSLNTGFFVVAVEIKEYRNGVLIGITRRDLQLIFITCPPNPAPNISAVTQPHLQDTIIEGETICFPVTYTDPNGDSLFLTSTGNIFNGAIVNPTATLANASGAGTVTSQFCWTTSCLQGQLTPYQFNVAVTDNGCPAKTTNNAYSILVLPFTTPPMTGSDTLCDNAITGIPYSAGPGLTGSTYNWIITNGTQVSGTNTANITVNWNGSPTGTIKVVAISANGCVGDTITKNITLKPVPAANAGANVAFCSGATVGVGSGTTAGFTYSWSPVTGVSNTAVSNPNVTLTNTGSTPVTTNYIVTVSNSGCLNRDTVQVTVNPAAIAAAGADQSVCNGSVINLGSAFTSGYSYNWTPGTGLSSTITSNPTLTYNNPGPDPDTLVYTVSVSNLYGCTAIDSVQVIVRPVPNANAGNNAIFCSGQSASIGSATTAGYTYSWSPATGLSSSASSNPTVTLTNSGTVNVSTNYIVTATWFGCTDQDTVVVTVKPMPVSNAGPDVVLCSGDTVPIGAASTPGYSYSWSPGAGLSSTITSNPNAIVSNAGPGADTLVYTVTTTLNGCTTSDSVRIIINTLPAVSGTVNPLAVCSGDTATLTGSGASTYSWALLSSPGSSIGTGTSITVTPTVNTSYIVTGTNSLNCKNTDTVVVVVNPLPAVQALAPSDSLCLGDSINVNGSGATGYSWALLTTPGTAFSIANSVLLGPSSTTSYILTGTDANGCVNRDTFQIYVNPAPLANAVNGNISVCPGVDGVSYAVTPATPGSVYTWGVIGGSLAGGQGSDSVFVDWDSSGTGIIYVVEVTGDGCPSDTILLAVSINVVLNPLVPSGLSPLCANQATGIIYSCLNTPQSTYTWHIQGGNIVSGNGTNSVTVDWTLTGPGVGALWYEEFSITSDTSCYGISDTIYVTINPSPATSAIAGNLEVCMLDSTGQFSVTATSGSSYSWNALSGTILSGSGTNSITATWGTSGTFTVYVIETNSFGCYGDTVSRQVEVNPLPVATAGSDVSICLGDNTTLTAGGGVGFTWTPSTGLSTTTSSTTVANPASTTTYIVEVTDTNSCKNTDTVTVTVNPLPPADAGPDASICLNSSMMLNATGGVNYLWSPATGLSATTGANPTANPSATTTYIVTVTDTNLCSRNDTITITVHPLPTAVASADSIICDGSSLILSASGGTAYSWSPAGSLNDPTSATPVATPGSTTTYTVTVFDANNCTDTEEVQVNVDAQPVAGFEIVDSVDCKGVTSYYKNTSTNATDYIWVLGDGTVTTEFEPVHFYTFSQSNSISLIAINNNCSDTLEIKSPVVSLEDYLKNVPNIFTPNGDGNNDCFSTEKAGKFKGCLDIKIFNRWGKLMFESATGDECWDGTNQNNGEKCDAGVYFYILKVVNVETKGTIHLMR